MILASQSFACLNESQLCKCHVRANLCVFSTSLIKKNNESRKRLFNFKLKCLQNYIKKDRRKTVSVLSSSIWSIEDGVVSGLCCSQGIFDSSTRFPLRCLWFCTNEVKWWIVRTKHCLTFCSLKRERESETGQNAGWIMKIIIFYKENKRIIRLHIELSKAKIKA